MKDTELPDPLPKEYHLRSYVIESELSPTAVGRMYKARDSRLNRIVAVNVLAAELRDQPKEKAKFERRVRNAVMAGQPVYGVEEWLGVLYVVVECSETRGALVDVSEH